MIKLRNAKDARTNRCHRCGGLMLEDRGCQIGLIEWRCVSCGERIDPVILAHRHEVFTRIEADAPLGGKAKTYLN